MTLRVRLLRPLRRSSGLLAMTKGNVCMYADTLQLLQGISFVFTINLIGTVQNGGGEILIAQNLLSFSSDFYNGLDYRG